MKKKALLLILLLIISLTTIAQRTPSLRCVEINENNRVSIYFIPPTESANFLNYKIFAAANIAGPYTLIRTSTSYDSEAFANVDDANLHSCYFLTASYDGDANEYSSDTIQTIELSMVHTAGMVQLSWTAPIDPLLETMDTWYRVSRKSPNDTEYQIVGYSNTLTYEEPVECVCEDSVRYKIFLGDEYLLETIDTIKCYNSSNVQIEEMTNTVAPGAPELRRVSVDPVSAQNHLYWNSSTEKDVNAYIIFRNTNPSDAWTPLDTVFGRMNTQYVDAVNPSNLVNYYRISAVDSCANSSPMTVHQQNIVLNHELDACERTLTISWNTYFNLIDDLQKYELLLNTDGAGYQVIETITDINATSYQFNNALPNVEYCFMLRAINTTEEDTATSTIECVLYNEEETDDFVEITAVNVVANEFLDIYVNTTGDEFEFVELKVYRSVGNDDNFTYYTSIPYVTDQADYQFTDMEVEVDKYYYYYKVDLIKPCNQPPVSSVPAHNILLKGETNAAHINIMEWLNFTPTSSYAIFRISETEVTPAVIDNSIPAANILAYQDDVSALFLQGEVFGYIVEANTTPPSRSNQIDLRQVPTTYIPNAFRPVGNVTNNVFLPKNSFVSMDSYTLFIYSSNGQLVFSSNNPYEGWDGTQEGKDCPMGVYVYRMEYTYGEGELFSRTGTVTLVR